jgi:putative SOS response-associated peptidase YedK
MVPMSGFFEWAHTSKGNKQPVYMSMPDSNPFFAAGLWEEWTDKETFSTLRSFTIITVPANAKIATYHERMPAILHKDDMLFWLGSESKADAALRTFPEHVLISKFVSLDVNNPKMNSASLLEEVQSDIHIENLIPTIPPGNKKLLLKNINENKQSTLF